MTCEEVRLSLGAHALGALEPDEAGVAVDVAGSPEEITERAAAALDALPEPTP